MHEFTSTINKDLRVNPRIMRESIRTNMIGKMNLLPSGRIICFNAKCQDNIFSHPRKNMFIFWLAMLVLSEDCNTRKSLSFELFLSFLCGYRSVGFTYNFYFVWFSTSCHVVNKRHIRQLGSEDIIYDNVSFH